MVNETAKTGERERFYSNGIMYHAAPHQSFYFLSLQAYGQDLQHFDLNCTRTNLDFTDNSLTTKGQGFYWSSSMYLGQCVEKLL